MTAAKAKPKKRSRSTANKSVVIHHARCGTDHHAFASCPDGTPSAYTGTRGKKKPNPQAQAALATMIEQGEQDGFAAAIPTPDRVEVAGTGMTEDEIKRTPLITDPAEIARLTPEQMRQQMLVRSAMDQAESAWKQGEAEAGVPLNRPNILKRTNEKAAELLLNQLAHVTGTAQTTRFLAEHPTVDNMKRLVPEEEVANTREVLASLPEHRDRKERERKDKEASKQHVNGDVLWVCETPGSECEQRPYRGRLFRGAALEVIRRKAAAEPGWTFSCPRCKGVRVRLLSIDEAREVA